MVLSNLSEGQYMCRMNRRRYRKMANLKSFLVNPRGIENKTYSIKKS